jgi:hypothetical protein
MPDEPKILLCQIVMGAWRRRLLHSSHGKWLAWVQAVGSVLNLRLP